MLGELDRQPIQRVQDREGRILAADAACRALEHLPRRSGRALQQRLGDRGLEQLAHDAEREPLLQLATAAASTRRSMSRRASANSRVFPIPAGPSTTTSPGPP